MARQAQAAAERAAALNADAGRASSYSGARAGAGAATAVASPQDVVSARVTVASIAGMPKVRAAASSDCRCAVAEGSPVESSADGTEGLDPRVSASWL